MQGSLGVTSGAISIIPVFESKPGDNGGNGADKPTADIWVEGEAYASAVGGSIRSEASYYGSNAWVLQTTKAPGASGYTASYNINVPIAGYYHLRVAGQPVGVNWTSPIWYSIDGGAGVHVTSCASSTVYWGLYSATHWTDLGLVNLTKGAHVLTFTVNERRTIDSNYAYAIDAIDMVLAGKTTHVVVDNDATDINANYLAVVAVNETSPLSYSIRTEDTSLATVTGTLNISTGAATLPLAKGVGWYEVAIQNSGATTALTNSVCIARNPRSPLSSSLVAVDGAMSEAHWLGGGIPTTPQLDIRQRLSQIEARVGVSWTRDRIDLTSINPSTNTYTWSYCDEAVNLQSSKGLQILEVLKHVPLHMKAQGYTDQDNVTPQSMWDSYKLGYVLSKHYDGTVTNAGIVKAFEFWNEPDLGGSLAMPLDQLVPHQQAFYLGVKDGNTNSTPLVVANISSVLPSKQAIATKYLQMLRDTGFDVFSFHWYHNDVTNQTTSLTKASSYPISFPATTPSAINLASGHKVWATEVGYKAVALNATLSREMTPADEASQADFMSKEHIMGAALGVDKVFGFLLSFYPEYNDYFVNDYLQFGMVRSKDCNPRPAISALANTAELLNAVTYKGAFTPSNSTVSGYIFQRTDGSVYPGTGSSYLMALWASPTQFGYTLPSGVTLSKVRDYLGRTVDVGAITSLTVTAQAKFLFFTNDTIASSIVAPPTAAPLITDCAPSRVVMCWHLPVNTTVDKNNDRYVIPSNTSTAASLEIVNLSTATYSATVSTRLSNNRWTLTPQSSLYVTIPARPTDLSSTNPQNRVVLNFTLSSPLALDEVQLQAQAQFDNKVVRTTQVVSTTTASCNQLTVGTATYGGILVDALQPTQNYYGYDDLLNWQSAYDATQGAYLIAINTASGAAPVPQSATSRRQHGSYGNFDVPLNYASETVAPVSTTVECRSGNKTNIVVAFDKAIVATEVTLAGGVAVVGAPTFSTTAPYTVTIPLTSMTNAQKLQLNLANVTAIDGEMLFSVIVTFGYLIGDVDGSGKVAASDLALVQSKLSANGSTPEFNPRADIDASGKIAASDLSMVQGNLSIKLP